MKTRNLGLAAFVAAALAFGAPAGAMPASAPEAQQLMQAYYGNTRICRIDGYFECHMWLNADGTYILFYFNSEKMAKETPDPRKGFNVIRGHWSIQGTKGNYKLCRIAEDAEDQEHKPTCGGEEPERPDMNGERMQVGDAFWKYHDNGSLKGTTEHYFIVRGHM